jgi:uroporphyrinogen-III synthase
MVIFTSPSGIQNFLKIWPKSGGQTIRMACIGPTTANAAVKNGFQPLVVAQNSSATGIFESILNFYILKP